MRRLRPGMTLIEIIVVLVIVVGLFSLTLMVTSLLSYSTLNKATARLATTIEHIYGRAAINGQRYRLVIDLDAGAYWAECSEENVPVPDLMNPVSDIQLGAHRFSRYEQEDSETDPFGLGLENAFDDCTEELIPRQELGDEVRIDAVMTTHQLEPAEEGQATVEFFPDGFVEPTYIWVSRSDDEDAVMTVRVEPMTGRVKVDSGRLELPDDFMEREEDR